MKLWLDDVRPAPEGWTLATNAAFAIRLLNENWATITDISLDHDLGTEGEEMAPDGNDVLLHIYDNVVENVWRLTGKSITVHSANPVENKLMRLVIARMTEFDNGKKS
jgi:hypothetical protein